MRRAARATMMPHDREGLVRAKGWTLCALDCNKGHGRSSRLKTWLWTFLAETHSLASGSLRGSQGKRVIRSETRTSREFQKVSPTEIDRSRGAMTTAKF